MIRWLVIGIGDLTTKRVIPAILEEPRSEFYGVVTRHPHKAGAYPGVRIWTDLNTALEDTAVDAVYVASPVFYHADHTIASLRAGKHVLCEKPVAMNYPEAQTMAAAGNTSDRVLGIAYFRRLFPKLIRAKQLIAEGAVGEPLLAQAHCHSWLESEERNWLRDPALAGGGPLYDIGSHRIDAMNFLFGAPQRATGLLSNVVHDMAVEDSATVLIDYANKVRGIVDVRWNSHIARDRFRVTGTDGELTLDPLQGHSLRVGDTLEDHPRHPNVHYPLVHNFVSAVLDGTPVACSADDAIQTDRVTSEVMRAAIPAGNK
jgi:1,5-anhydro-D-fructose reductase (1,5-anhydro-D-mannitol-forming)